MRGRIAAYIIISAIMLIAVHAQDSVFVVNTVSSFNTWTYAEISSAVAITAIMIHFDQRIYDNLYSWKKNNRVVKNISPVITNMGDGAFSIGLFGGFAGYGFIFKDKKAIEAAKIGAESLLFTGITVQLFKHLFERERPSHSTQTGGFWHGPFAFLNKKRRQNRSVAAFDAFPSGHTTTIFSAATTISDFYTDEWVSYTCYSFATLTAVSRVTESTHWISDCFVGAVIGYYGTKLIEKWNYGSSDVSVLPYTSAEQYGLIFSVKL